MESADALPCRRQQRASSVRQEVQQKQEVEERTDGVPPALRRRICPSVSAGFYFKSFCHFQVPNMAATTPISPEEEEELREAFSKIGKRKCWLPVSPVGFRKAETV